MLDKGYESMWDKGILKYVGQRNIKDKGIYKRWLWIQWLPWNWKTVNKKLVFLQIPKRLHCNHFIFALDSNWKCQKRRSEISISFLQPDDLQSKQFAFHFFSLSHSQLMREKEISTPCSSESSDGTDAFWLQSTCPYLYSVYTIDFPMCIFIYVHTKVKFWSELIPSAFKAGVFPIRTQRKHHTLNEMENLQGSAGVGCVVDPKSSRSRQLSTPGLLSASSAQAPADIYTSNYLPRPPFKYQLGTSICFGQAFTFPGETHTGYQADSL